MEVKQLFQVQPGENGEIIIRTGDAPEIAPPVKIQISGEITAPRVYYEAKKGNITPDFKPGITHVIVSRDKAQIILIHNDKDYYQDQISGALVFSSECQALGINSTNSPKTPLELAKLLKRNRHLFADAEQGMRIISDLMDFQGTVKAEIKEAKDNRGNRKNSLAVSVETNIPVEFGLKIPMFKGQAAQYFGVEILLEANGNSILCFLESARFMEMVDREIDNIIDQEIAVFKDDGLAVIEV